MRLILTAFLLSVGGLVGVSVLSYDNTRGLRDAGRWVAHTQEVRGAIHGVESATAAVQGATLRYLLSGNEQQLGAYEMRRAAVAAHLDTLEALTADNPVQHRRMGVLRAHVDALLRSGREAIARRRAGPLTVASLDSESARSVRAMAAAGQTIGAMQAEELRLLEARRHIVDNTADRSLLTLAGLSVATVILLVGAFIATRAEGRRRLRAEHEVRAINATLTSRVAELEWRTREVTALNDASEMLQSCHTTEEAYAAMGQFVQRLVRTNGGLIAVTKDSDNLVECVTAWGELTDGPSFALEDCCALRSGRPVTAVPSDAVVRCTHRTVGPIGAGQTVCIPLLAHGETLGVLHVHLTGDESPFTTSEFSITSNRVGDPVQLLTRVSEHCAIAFANLRLRDRLQHESIRDPLTGAFNRRHFEASLDREISRAMRHGLPAGLLMLDVDHFKQFNDRFGHDAGDTILRELAAVLHNAVREEDIICRYGGEEFAILLPETSLDVARQRAESMLALIRGIRIEQRGHHVGPVTASIGVATYPTHSESPQDLIRTADRALYRAKELGRDRAEIAPQLSIRRDEDARLTTIV